MITFEEEENEPARQESWEARTAEMEEPIDLGTGEVIPPGGEPTQEQNGDFGYDRFVTPEFCATLLSMYGNRKARETGHDFWRPDEEEKNLLGETFQPLAAELVRRYLGDSGGIWGPTLLALTIVYMPRILREHRLQEKEKRDREKARRQQNGQEPTPPTSTEESAPSSDLEDAENQSNSSEYQSPFSEV